MPNTIIPYSNDNWVRLKAAFKLGRTLLSTISVAIGVNKVLPGAAEEHETEETATATARNSTQ